MDVFNTHLEEPIQLGSLSSGEKQIISIFSKLILNLDKKFLILIDEPELSLSLEWQQRLLPDMLKQNSCNQIIAITHSPFIFDNEFDANATTIEIKINGKIMVFKMNNRIDTVRNSRTKAVAYFAKYLTKRTSKN